MGTNFYLKSHDRATSCPTCGHTAPEPEPLHIGKSSVGWCFSLHVEEDGPKTLDDWKLLFEDGGYVIEDEYGQQISSEEMLGRITDRSGTPRTERSPSSYASWEQFYRQNHAEPGPNHLSRHVVDGRHCLAHGEGTWDLIAGEFC